VRALAALGVVLAACGGPKRVDPTAPFALNISGSVTIPLRLVRDVPLVQIKVDGGAPEWFVLDTGAPMSVVATRISSRMQQHTSDVAIHVSGTTPGEFDTKVFQFDGLRVGSLTFDDVSGIVSDLAALDERIGFPIGGILGFPPFADLLLTLDYPNQRAIVDHGSLPEPNQRDVLLLRDHAMHPSIVLRIAGVDTITEIDSGSGFFMEIAQHVGDKLAVLAPPVVAGHAMGIAGLAPQRAVKLDGDVKLGVQTVHHPLIYLGEDPSLDTDQIARIGGPLLAHFAVTFDQRTRAVRFTRADQTPLDPGPLKSLGLELVKRGAGWQIIDLIPNTPAAALDVRRGDVLVSVEGKPTVDLDAGDWERTYNTISPLHIGIARGTTHLDVVIPVAILVP
jgi:hypothetical protein